VDEEGKFPQVRQFLAPGALAEAHVRIGIQNKQVAWRELANSLDIIANNPIDQKVVELSFSQPYSLVEHSMYRSVFPPQGV
jgi:hypothetical protein